LRLCVDSASPAGNGKLIYSENRILYSDSHSSLFVDGCFWHGCPKHSNLPVNNREFWRKKLDANKARDVLVNRTLRKLGWRVLRVWEHDLRRGREPITIRRIKSALTKQSLR